MNKFILLILLIFNIPFTLAETTSPVPNNLPEQTFTIQNQKVGANLTVYPNVVKYSEDRVACGDSCWRYKFRAATPNIGNVKIIVSAYAPNGCAAYFNIYIKLDAQGRITPVLATPFTDNEWTTNSGPRCNRGTPRNSVHMNVSGNADEGYLIVLTPN